MMKPKLSQPIAIAVLSLVAWLGVVPLPETATGSARATEISSAAIAQLSDRERDQLNRGKAIVTGEKGSYVAKVLIPAGQATVWEVLTDYRNFSRFLPNVVSCQVLEATGNQTTIEQIDERQVFGLGVRSRIKTVNIKTPQTRIDFRQIEGDLTRLEGYWTIETVTTSPGDRFVLLTQVVQAQPNDSTPQGIFYSIFKDALADTLGALRQEAIRRS
jgi:ribosome-associated toxin RatA of RatAB toxin-antitoxin module